MLVRGESKNVQPEVDAKETGDLLLLIFSVSRKSVRCRRTDGKTYLDGARHVSPSLFHPMKSEMLPSRQPWMIVRSASLTVPAVAFSEARQYGFD